MKLYKIVIAFDALCKVGRLELPMQELFRVRNKMREIQPHLAFYVEQEKKNAGDPVKKAELLDVEIELSPAVEIVATENMRLSYSDLVNLEGIIEIKFGKENDS